MKVTLLGVRGSRCAPGVAYAGVGGNTSCVLVRPRDPAADPLILDAGTGLCSIPVIPQPFSAEVLLTHLHWDHVQGIPFFAAGDREDSQVRVRLPAQGAARPDRPGSAAALLADGMSPPHFPVGPEALRGAWSFDALEPSTFETGPFRVTAIEVPHKGGRTFGYRVQEDGATLAYLPDYCVAVSGAACVEVLRGADVALLGAMFSSAERDVAHGYGHATVDEAVALAAAARVGRTVALHHAPTRPDAEVEAMMLGVPVGLAAGATAGSAAGATARLTAGLTVGREGDVVLDSDSRSTDTDECSTDRRLRRRAQL